MGINNPSFFLVSMYRVPFLFCSVVYMVLYPSLYWLAFSLWVSLIGYSTILILKDVFSILINADKTLAKRAKASNKCSTDFMLYSLGFLINRIG